MLIFPAIDIYGGKAVRLYKGDFEQMTVYGDDPVKIARDFVSQGAEYAHIVDLEGARYGGTPNIKTVERIVNETPLFVEIGGGVRSIKTVERYLSAGVQRVILGTAAVKNREFLFEAAEKFGEKIAVGADVKNGRIAVNGWTETADLTLSEFMEILKSAGVKTVICTDVSKDGAMQGTGLDLYKSLAKESGINIIASGGVSSLTDVKKLKEIPVYGAIIGKAYYTGALGIKEAIEAAK